MPDTAIHKSPLESAADDACDTVNLGGELSCSGVNINGNLAEFELTAAISDTSNETVQLELGHALIAAGNRLLQHGYFDQGVKHGRWLQGAKR